MIHLRQFVPKATYHVLFSDLLDGFPGNLVEEFRLRNEHLVFSGDQAGHTMITLLLCNRWMENGNLVNISDFILIINLGFYPTACLTS